MEKLHFEYDSEENVLRFKDKNAAYLLALFLSVGKLGERLDERLIFNASFAQLQKELQPLVDEKMRDTRTLSGANRGAVHSLGREFLGIIGKQIAHDIHLDWWTKTRSEQIEFLKAVVLYPHDVSEDDIQFILDAVDDEIHNARTLMERSSGSGR